MFLSNQRFSFVFMYLHVLKCIHSSQQSIIIQLSKYLYQRWGNFNCIIYRRNLYTEQQPKMCLMGKGLNLSPIISLQLYRTAIMPAHVSTIKNCIYIHSHLPKNMGKKQQFYSKNETLKIISKYIMHMEFSWWLRWYRICLQCRRYWFDAWVGTIPWRRKWQRTSVSLPGESMDRGAQQVHGVAIESDTTYQLSNNSTIHMQVYMKLIPCIYGTNTMLI